MNGLDILIPCKSFRRGKSRLAPVLSHAAREHLCRQLLVRTLSLARCFATRVAVVSDDPDVLSLVVQRDVLPIAEENVGLNAALYDANAQLLREEDSNPLLVLPIDLPLLDSPTLGRFLTSPAQVLIAPDAKEQGTNLLRICPAARRDFDFRYGPGSFERHIDAAACRSLTVSLFRSEFSAIDLDELSDFGTIQRSKAPIVLHETACEHFIR